MGSDVQPAIIPIIADYGGLREFFPEKRSLVLAVRRRSSITAYFTASINFQWDNGRERSTEPPLIRPIPSKGISIASFFLIANICSRKQF